MQSKNRGQPLRSRGHSACEGMHDARIQVVHSAGEHLQHVPRPLASIVASMFAAIGLAGRVCGIPTRPSRIAAFAAALFLNLGCVQVACVVCANE
jgi:hypothetical protein